MVPGAFVSVCRGEIQVIMSAKAVFWIRDGVLVDRMHINPVAFAVATWLYAHPQKRTTTSVESLINFGFASSGLSCADKMRLFNEQCIDIVGDIDAASRYYNQLATQAALDAHYFDGAVDLLRDLHLSGAKNFITSAVEQSVLDSWSLTEPGQMIAPYLTEILGKRPGLTKGREHFEYALSQYDCSKIYYVADATAEIVSAKEYARTGNIAALGFAHVITKARVMQAVDSVLQAACKCHQDKSIFDQDLASIKVDSSLLVLSTQQEIVSALTKAGAEAVISGSGQQIMANLCTYFKSIALLKGKSPC